MLVNDFGAINIDADLIFGVDHGLISLSNGCVCCSIRDDLLEAVTRVLERPEHPEYVMLEASGVAEPSGIMATFANETVRDRIRLDSITCVLDAEQVFAAPEQMRLKLFQIAFADLLILNKVDLVDDAQKTRIKVWLDEHFHRYRLIEAERGNVPLEVLLSCGRFDAARLGADDSVHSDPHCGHDHRGHPHNFSTMSYETDRPFSLALLRDIVARLPTDIYRCKGVIHSVDAPQRRVVLQVVGKRVDISLEHEWGSRPPRTRIVAIGASGAIAADELRAQFDQCVAGDHRG